MKNMDMNTVISWGLVVMGVLSVAGWIAYSIHTGTSGGTEIPIAISSGLVGVLTGKNVAQHEFNRSNTPPPVERQILAHTNEQLEKTSDLADTALEMLASKRRVSYEQGKGEAPNGESEHQGN